MSDMAQLVQAEVYCQPKLSAGSSARRAQNELIEGNKSIICH